MRRPSTRPTSGTGISETRPNAPGIAADGLLERARRMWKPAAKAHEFSWPYVIYLQPAASWLPLVEQRIEDSTIPREYEHDRITACESGEWLEEDVAASALSFFRAQSDLLPNEPYIYASRTGDLVAEFAGSKGQLTTIVGPEAVTLFAVAKGKPEEMTLYRWSNSLRDKLREFQALISE